MVGGAVVNPGYETPREERSNIALGCLVLVALLIVIVLLVWGILSWDGGAKWTKLDHGCYLMAQEHRSVNFNDYTTRVTLCPVNR